RASGAAAPSGAASAWAWLGTRPARSGPLVAGSRRRRSSVMTSPLYPTPRDNCPSARRLRIFGRGFVQPQPEGAECLHHVGELGELDRLAHVAVSAALVAGKHVVLQLGAGEDDDGNHLGPPVSSDPAQYLKP